MSEPTLGEVMRRIDDLVQRLETLTNKVEESYVRYEVFNAAIERLAKVEDRSEWVVRLMLGLIISAIVGTVLVASR